MHSIAASSPAEMGETEKAQYIAFFKSIGDVLPCPSCRSHYTEYLTTHSIADALSQPAPLNPAWPGNIALQEWVHRLHNEVNKRTSKPLVTATESFKAYHTSCFDNDNHTHMSSPDVLNVDTDNATWRMWPITLTAVCVVVFYMAWRRRRGADNLLRKNTNAITSTYSSL